MIVRHSLSVIPRKTKQSRNPSESASAACFGAGGVSAVLTVLDHAVAGFESDTREVKPPDGDFITATGTFLSTF